MLEYLPWLGDSAAPASYLVTIPVVPAQCQDSWLKLPVQWGLVTMLKVTWSLSTEFLPSFSILRLKTSNDQSTLNETWKAGQWFGSNFGHFYSRNENIEFSQTISLIIWFSIDLNIVYCNCHWWMEGLTDWVSIEFVLLIFPILSVISGGYLLAGGPHGAGRLLPVLPLPRLHLPPPPVLLPGSPPLLPRPSAGLCLPVQPRETPDTFQGTDPSPHHWI